MSKLKYLLFLLFIPFTVNAACSSTELSKYKSLAAHVNNYYDYNGSSFDVTIYNLSSELKVVDKGNGNTYYADSNMGDLVIRGYSAGSSVNFAIYPINGECSDYRVFTIYVNLPHYNNYFNDEVCLNNSNSLCSKWINTSMYSHDEFVQKVKESNAQEITPDIEPEKIDEYGFFDFLADYYIFILLGIIVLGSTGIYFLDKKNRFDL